MNGIDLHTHSNRSDGTDSPQELVTKARQVAELSVVAITDHDTTAGWAEAVAAGKALDITVVRGIELTTKIDGRSQHLLAYEPDPDHPELVTLLETTVKAREERIPRMVQLIAQRHPSLTLDIVLQAAAGATPGRPHIADAMIDAGLVRDRAEAFSAFLSPGCATYVSRWAPPIEEAIAVVRRAGGVTVMAHPRARQSAVTAERLRELADLGLGGLEVDHQEHDSATRAELRAIAGEVRLVATGSSDYHGTAKIDHDLGCNTTSPVEYDRLMAHLRTAQAAVGR